jgi:CheY-like chemotaxis protein
MGRAGAAVSVLLVEDEVLISRLVADWLSQRGFAVHEAASAEEAMHYLDSGAPVDLLFTDVNLPGGMDGAQLAQQVRQRRPELPVVYTSGRARSSDIGALVPRSIFVPKPYDPEDVCTLLTRLTAAAAS